VNRKITQISKVLLTLSCAIILTFICYFFFITLLVNPWLENNQRELRVLNFYSQKNSSSVPEIYFLGTSQVKEGIDCNIIEDDFKKSNSSFICYNLAVNGDTPLRRLIELDSIIKTKPEVVVIGTEYRDIYNSGTIADSRLILVSDKIVSDKIILDTTSTELFDKEQLRLLHLNPINRGISNRIFIISYLNFMTLNKLIHNSVADYENRDNFKNPYKDSENTPINEKIDRINENPPIDDFPTHYDNSTNKLALRHIIQELQKNNITVIVINVPCDPLEFKYISNSTRENYVSYLNNIEVPYYDFENRYPSNYFYDITHTNVQGRTAFSHDIAKIILKEVEK